MTSQYRAHDALYRLRGVPLPGDVIAGKYLVESPCRRGGVALEVTAVPAHMAPPATSRVDIRLLPPEWCGDPAIVERFLCEGQAAAPLTSEHVVRVFDVGTMEGGAPYFVLEHLDGPSLDELVSAWGSVPVPTAIDWVLQAAEAIAEAHARGVVHQRLKLSSFILADRRDGTRSIKVRDFGLSRVVDPFSGYADAGFENAAYANRRLSLDPNALQSVHYIAPEQLRAAQVVDARADIWSLGVILHELIAGRPPFDGETVPSVCAAVMAADAPHLCSLRPDVPAGVDRAVRRCLQRDPGQRFPNLSTLAHALAGWGTSLASASCQRIDALLGADTSNDPIPLVSRMFSRRAPTVRVPTLRMSAPVSGSEPELDNVRMRAPASEPELGNIDAVLDHQTAYDANDEEVPRVFKAPASGRVVALALVMLAALGAAAFAGLYQSVHGEGPIGHAPPAVIAAPTTPVPAAATSTP